MPTLAEELERLHQADQHIADATKRIAAQRRLVASMEEATVDRTRAEELLQTMLATLDQFSLHRQAILETIRRLQDGEGRSR
jgi:hypothetical protein